MSLLQKLKYKIHLRKDLKRRLTIINNCNINILFDIGANTGQFARKMRNLGYDKKIISFEPVNVAFDILKKASLPDKNWIVRNYALGNEDAKGIINVSGRSDNSSILDMLPKHYESNSDFKYIGQQEIEINKLDSVFDSFLDKPDDRVMIKLIHRDMKKM